MEGEEIKGEIKTKNRMERRSDAFKNLFSDPKNPTLDDYFTNIKASFRRIWKNRFLWFWGLFLPGSMGIGFNLDEQLSGLEERKVYDLQVFVVNNLEAVAFLSVIFLFFWLSIWYVSAISRSGVIQSLFCLQKPKNRKKLGCKEVWRMGKKDFKNILILDFFMGIIILVIFLALLVPVAVMFLTDNQAGAIFLFITLLVLFFVFAVFMNYLLQISTIYVVLANVEILQAIGASYRLITRNLVEVVKLFSIFFLIGILQGTAFLLIVTALMPFWGTAVDVWLELYQNSFANWALFSSAIMVLLTIIFLFAKTIFSLWIQDVWIWWVQRIGGNRVSTEKNKFIRHEKLLELGAVVGARSTVGNK